MQPISTPVLMYPLIVKPLYEDGSVGITKNSVVQDHEGLTQRVGEILSLYRQPALVEEYTDGREIHAAIMGNNGSFHLFPLVETVFHTPPGIPQIVSYDGKWLPGSTEWNQIQPGCLADLDEELKGEIIHLAARVYRALTATATHGLSSACAAGSLRSRSQSQPLYQSTRL